MHGLDDRVHWLIWLMCLCAPCLIAAIMLMRDAVSGFFPWYVVASVFSAFCVSVVARGNGQNEKEKNKNLMKSCI